MNRARLNIFKNVLLFLYTGNLNPLFVCLVSCVQTPNLYSSGEMIAYKLTNSVNICEEYCLSNIFCLRYTLYHAICFLWSTVEREYSQEDAISGTKPHIIFSFRHI